MNLKTSGRLLTTLSWASYHAALASYVRARLGPVRHLVLIVLLFNLIFNVPFWVLHHYRLMLAEYDPRAPYHFEPRFAQRLHLLASSSNPDIIFTGDSRVEMGINPELIPEISAFNFAVGSQTIPMTEHIVLKSLAKLGKSPRFLVLGITPDYMSSLGIRDDSTAALIRAFEKGEEYQANGPVLKKVQERMAPALFYRQTVFRDLGRLRMCFTQAEPPDNVEGGLPLIKKLTWWEYYSTFDMPMTPRGYNPDDAAAFVKGDYPPSQGLRARLKPPYQPDREELKKLVGKIRGQNIEPLFLIMPFHDSFFDKQFHPGVREALADAVRDVAQEQDVLILKVSFDTAKARYYWDAHHMSTEGATIFSAGLRAEFLALLQTGELDRRYHQRFPTIQNKSSR